MTFESIDEFIVWLYKNHRENLLETYIKGDDDKWVTIFEIQEMDPLEVTEVLVSAYDSDFHFGYFDATSYGGTITFRE